MCVFLIKNRSLGLVSSYKTLTYYNKAILSEYFNLKFIFINSRLFECVNVFDFWLFKKVINMYFVDKMINYVLYYVVYIYLLFPIWDNILHFHFLVLLFVAY